MNLKRKELFRFVIAGSAAVLTDFGSYNLLLLGDVPANLAKGVSFLLGTVVAFVVNKYWTFEKKERSYKEAVFFLSLYLITLFVNVSVNRLMLEITQHTFFSFLVATGCSTILNFAGQKWWVFKS